MCEICKPCCSFQPRYGEQICPDQPRSSQISVDQPDQRKSAQMRPDQSRSAEIWSDQRRSAQISPYQPRSPRSAQISPDQPISPNQTRSTRSAQIRPDQPRSAQIKPDQPEMLQNHILEASWSNFWAWGQKCFKTACCEGLLEVLWACVQKYVKTTTWRPPGTTFELEARNASKRPPGGLLKLLLSLRPEMLQNGLLETSYSYF